MMTMKKGMSFLMIGLFFALIGCQELPESKDPTGKELSLTWELKENGHDGKGQSLNAFSLTNHSQDSLKSNWTIYFHQPRKVIPGSFGDHFTISHINGDYFKLEPTEKFTTLAPTQTVEFTFVSEAWFLKAVDAPSGLYIVFKDEQGQEQMPQLIEDMKVLPLTKGAKLAIDATSFIDVPTASSLYERNILNTQIDQDSLCPITPSPISCELGDGVFELKTGMSVSFSPSLENEADFLIESLGKDFNLVLSKSKEGQVSLLLDSLVDSREGSRAAYELKVDEKGVSIKGRTAAAVFYGIQSLRAVVPVTAYEKKADVVPLPQLKVTDAPRFEYRGLHLDVVRNFQTKQSVLKVLDLMSFYKLNKFHFHLCDDEGWRLAIEGLPELTEVGSKRGHSLDESEMINPAYGSGPFAVDNTPGTGHYSKNDFIEILKFAHKRHIEVIPELDFPGHARAAIVSMKARQKKFLALGKEKEANEYLLHDPKDKSQYTSIQLYNDNVISVGQEST
jgi:hexosaminidase